MNVDFLRRPRRGIERAAPAVPLRVPHSEPEELFVVSMAALPDLTHRRFSAVAPVVVTGTFRFH